MTITTASMEFVFRGLQLAQFVNLVIIAIALPVTSALRHVSTVKFAMRLLERASRIRVVLAHRVSRNTTASMEFVNHEMQLVPYVHRVTTATKVRMDNACETRLAR